MRALSSALVNTRTGPRGRMLDIAMACHAFNDMNLRLMQFNPELFVPHNSAAKR